MNKCIIIIENIEQILRILISSLFLIMSYDILLREDFAEYTKCNGCDTSLLLCDCNCPKCGKRNNCECNLKLIRYRDLRY